MVDVHHHQSRQVGIEVLAPGTLYTFLINRGVEHRLEAADGQLALGLLFSRLSKGVDNRDCAFALRLAAKPLGSQFRHRTVNVF